MSEDITSKLFTSTDFFIGVGLAISSSFFIGSSFIIKKKALLKQSASGLRAGDGGFGYLREWLWWAGFLTMAVGEFANFTAYAFAPASVVTPLGALSVLVATVLSTKFLREKLNLLGKLGCFLCILGSTVTVLHAPKSEEVEHLAELLGMLQEPGFIIYVSLILLTCLFVGIFLAPRYGHVNVLVYVTLCSAVGSLTVMWCKGLGLGLRETMIGNDNAFTNWLTWTFFGLTVICITIQMNYLNKALDLFNTGIVTPVYYVMFTTLVLIASAILYKEWQSLSISDVIGNLCGFIIIIIAVMLLNSFKDVDISCRNMNANWVNRRDYAKHEYDNGYEESCQKRNNQYIFATDAMESLGR